MINKTRVKEYCKDFTKIENYDKAIADTTQTWCCHHRLETHNSVGERRLVDISPSELKALGMYYDRPPEELIFLTRAEHQSLHSKGRHPSKENRRKVSEARKGKPAWNKGKPGTTNNGMHRSEEWKRKVSEALKGKPKSEEHKRKLSEARKGKHWKLVDGKRVWY